MHGVECGEEKVQVYYLQTTRGCWLQMNQG